MDDLTAQFKKLETSVVTVWSDSGHGTGFLIDAKGFVLTNHHVVGSAPMYVALQFDAARKIPAIVLASNAERDVALLWANFTAIPEATVAKIATAHDGAPTVIEGERVFTIGSPLTQRKVITSGIASRIEKGAIISDVNINPGNSGGPLFNSLGEVVGMTTFIEHDDRGAGVSGIVRIEEALPVIEQGKTAAASMQPPEPALLPVEPTDSFPLDALKATIAQPKFDDRPYFFSAGAYNVVVATPPITYWHRYAPQLAAAREKESRNRKAPQAVQGTFQPLDELRTWAAYAGEYRPVVQIFIKPQLRETFWSSVGRGLLAGAAAYSHTATALPPAKLRYASDFYRMKLMCGGREVQPIHPARSPEIVTINDVTANATDATYIGAYTYPADAISPQCGSVTLTIWSEKTPAQPTTKVLDTRTVQRVWADFAPYRDTHK